MSGAETAAGGSGRFVALEGMDGAGTTTQARAVVRVLEAADRLVLYTREPSDGVVGAYIRRVLRGEVSYPISERAMAALFAADRLDHWDREIGPALARGVDVVSDRYVLSSLAYQGTMTQDLLWVEQLNAHAPPPDLTVLLDLPEADAELRRAGRGQDKERYEVEETQRAVAQAYRHLAASLGAMVLDGRRPPEELTAAIVAAMEEIEG